MAIAQNRKQPTCSSAGEWIYKIWYINIWNTIWQLKGKEILINSATWMNIKTIILSERRQSQKTTYRMTIYMKCEKRQIYGDRKQIIGCPGPGLGMESDCK